MTNAIKPAAIDALDVIQKRVVQVAAQGIMGKTVLNIAVVDAKIMPVIPLMVPASVKNITLAHNVTNVLMVCMDSSVTSHVVLDALMESVTKLTEAAPARKTLKATNATNVWMGNMDLIVSLIAAQVV